MSGIVIRSWWFSLVCLVLLLNLTACTCDQWVKLARSVRYFSADHRISRSGVTVFHSGLILIVAGSLISGAFGMSGYLMVAEGETRFENHNDYEFIEEGSFFKEKRHSNIAIKLVSGWPRTIYEKIRDVFCLYLGSRGCLFGSSDPTLWKPGH